ncbi:MAG TPA: YicC/YloC family endoribonuclease [Usitatibacteraceae bacterium]|nr:YicC/YloC family endoribonuclease [Usitatibacteraceae bacterium]
MTGLSPAPAIPEDIERAMIASMTGFAAATREVAGGQLAVELKSVNHRYLEFQCRMAEDLRILEPVLREAVAAGLTRGKVDCRLTFTPAGAGERSLSPDGKAMAALAEASAAVAAVFPQARALSVNEVLHWPGVLANAEVAADQIREDVAKLAAQAVAELTQTRRREGGKLGQVLRERLEAMAALVAQAQPLMPEVMKSYREKLAARLAEAAAAPSDERIQQEVVLYAARIDVDEELERLGAHVAEFRRVLDKGGACGKRLDFLCQELNREANTLGSKSVSSDMTRISVELKVLIEQMREQVQNIE